MNKIKVIRTMRVFVPVVTVALVIGDFILAGTVGEAGTYTAQIRIWFYSHLGMALFLPTVIGALWAHLCWTPGAEIEAIKQALRRKGYARMEEAMHLDGVPKYQVSISKNGSVGHRSEWELTPKQAWRDVELLG